MEENNTSKRTRRTAEERRQYLMEQLKQHEAKSEQKIDLKLQAAIKMLEDLKEMARSQSSSKYSNDVAHACGHSVNLLWGASQAEHAPKQLGEY